MKKRVFSLGLAAVLLLGICGCKSSKKDSSDTVSYITSYEDEIISGDSGAASGDKTSSSTSGSKGGKTSSGTTIVPNKGSIENNLDFKGQTFTKTIIGAISQATMRRKAAFEKKFNCNIQLVSLQWESYNSQVATAMSSGKPYDICGLHTTFWPEAGVQGLYEPLNKYIYESDLYNSKTGVGIDLNASKTFELNGNLYGVANHTGTYVSMLQVLYYNKLMFEEVGLEDPMELYKAGKWNWNKFFEIAAKVKNPQKGKYLIGQEFSAVTMALSNGFTYTKNQNGKVVENLSDPKFLTALNKYSEFMKNYAGPKGYSDDATEFYNGNYYMFLQGVTHGKMYMYDTIKNSAAFDYDFSNLGVVPFPYGPDNTKKVNPGHGLQAKAAGKGSKDPRVVIAWTKFDLEFKDPAADEDPHQYSPEINKVINSLFDNVNDFIPNYKTASQSAQSLIEQIHNAAKNGGDVTQAIANNKKTIQSIIDDSLGQK